MNFTLCVLHLPKMYFFHFPKKMKLHHNSECFSELYNYVCVSVDVCAHVCVKCGGVPFIPPQLISSHSNS